MKFGILAIVLFVSACTGQQGGQQAQDLWPTQAATAEQPGTKYVKVLGRTWTVYPSEEQISVYVAQRDNLDLNPFGAPSARRSPQAARAIERATGCGVLHGSMIQDISARFFARVKCS